MLSNEELLQIKGGNASYWDKRFPALSLAVRYCHIVYLMKKLFVD